MTILLLQILGLLFLIFWASRIFIKVLGQLLFRIFKNQLAVVKGLAFILLPGTFIHEAAHLILAEFMQVRTDGISVMPEIKADRSIKLGGVKIEQTDPLRRTLIGLAPVFFGLILIWVATAYSKSGMEWVFVALYIYLLLQVGLTMFSSAKDLEGSVVGLFLASLVFLLVKYIGEIVTFVPLINAKNQLVSFVSHNLFYLRNGLFYSLVVIVVTMLLVSVVLVPLLRSNTPRS